MTTARTTHQVAETLTENTISPNGQVAHQVAETLTENTISPNGQVAHQVAEVLLLPPDPAWDAQTPDILLDDYDPNRSVSGIATVTRPESTYELYLEGDTANITSLEMVDCGLLYSFVNSIVDQLKALEVAGDCDISGDNATPADLQKVKLQQMHQGGWTVDFNGKNSTGNPTSTTVIVAETVQVSFDDGLVDAQNGYAVDGVLGVDGTFTTVDDKTVTVSKGIITAISS